MDVLGVAVGPFASNCYIAGAPGAREVLVIDPGDDADQIARILQARELTPVCYLLTHGHMDHVSALADLREQFPAPVAMHPLDAEWAFTIRNTMPPFYIRPPRAVPIDRSLADGQEWEDAGLRYRVLHTPGHSRGSVSLYFPDAGVLFPGDVLFRDSIGRTDLPGGDVQAIYESLRRLFELPDETRVYPGHGPETTIGRERRYNPFVTGAYSRDTDG